MYEWNTIDGRFEAARDVMRLRDSGKEKEAAELAEILQEANAAYSSPTYFVLMDKKNKQLLFLYGECEAIGENEFERFIKKHIDNYICHVRIGCTWMHGLICQEREPTIMTEKYEKWNVFETEDGQLWFEQM